MNVFIMGAGSVGAFLCEKFSLLHQVTVFERDPIVAQEIDERYDVRVVCDPGCSAKILSEYNVNSCDFFIAMTRDDRTNILTCSIAKALGAKMTIARASDSVYTDYSYLNYQALFGIDLFINPEALCALELAKEIRGPGRVAIERFSNGRIEAMQVTIPSSSKFIGKTLKEINFDSRVRIGCIYRGTCYEFATSETKLMVGDIVTLVGEHDILSSERERLVPNRNKLCPSVTIYGGEETAIALIKALGTEHYKLRLIEKNINKCKKLSEIFTDITIINGEGTSVNLLKEEQINYADFFVACTKVDEDNIMSSLQAEHLGAKNAMFIINDGDYDQVLNDIGYKLGIRKFVSPRIATYAELQHYLSGEKMWEVAELNDGAGYFLQVEVSPRNENIGKKISEITWPLGSIVVVLCHDFESNVPSADSVIAAGDKMIIVAPANAKNTIAEMFL